ncbi:hypothetical protein [Burkholderia gladioli]|uniref:hypothetical protein n=1 Tax=Burkholderia gladioli TaxID=28095 RepID=UPI0015E47A06|nr:hypothetical protein [Burkholderia gladioli]MBU9186814.1 hypothetical protein [Burkholderia gladioli]MBU9270887.1 hypothetical protein [Burkholderia gladioli]MDD1787418.1 hypothetical protein [Burkholderia gladioli]
MKNGTISSSIVPFVMAGDRAGIRRGETLFAPPYSAIPKKHIVAPPATMMRAFSDSS